MAIVKVWNDNRFDHTEKYKGQEVTIKSGAYIEMDYIDAVDFAGQYTPMKMLGPNNPDPHTFKMIRVEQPAEPIIKEDANVFHASGQRFQSPQEVIALANAYARLNPDLVANDPSASSVSKPQGPEYDALMQRIATLEAQAARAKPGPKPKAKEA